MRSIEWLEKPLWQRSAFELLAGPKGSGKGAYLAGLAARITQAGANALFVSTEDSTAIDLKPRLVAAGADIARCFDIPLHVQLTGDVFALQNLATRSAASGSSSSTPSRTTSAAATVTATARSETRSRR